MSVITKIEEQKNKSRVNIFVDGSFFCGLNKETAVIFGLKVGKEVDEHKLEEAVTASEVKSAFDKATDYIGSRMHTKKELIDKLTKKGYSKTVAESAVTKLEEYHYVDDEQFAKLFISTYNNLSNKMLSAKLMQKGIKKDIIEGLLSDRSDDLEIEACLKYAKSYAKGKDLTDSKTVQKMYASLARRGFGFDIIKKVCKNLVSNFDDMENFEIDE